MTKIGQTYAVTMGILDVFRRTGIVAAAAAADGPIELDPTRVFPPYDGNLVPPLMAQLDAPFGWDWGTTGCLSVDMAMKVPAVRRCVRVLCDAVASMPLSLWRDLEQLPTPAFLHQPEDWRPRSATIRETVMDLIFYPAAWWKVTARDFLGRPLVAVRLDPAYVTVQRVPGSSEIDRVTATYKGVEVPQADLIRFDGPDKGILAYGHVEIITALKLELAAQIYADPEIPSGVLTNTGQYRLTPGERVELLTQWRAARYARSTAFLDANVDYKNTQAMPDQLQLVQGREECAAQIARLFNLPGYYANAKSGDSMTYTSVPAQRRDLVDLSLQPYIQAIEDRLSMNDRNGTPRGQSVRLNRKDLLRSDSREDAEVGEILIRSGQSTANEQRANRGLPPITPAAGSAPPAAGATDDDQEDADAQAA